MTHVYDLCLIICIICNKSVDYIPPDACYNTNYQFRSSTYLRRLNYKSILKTFDVFFKLNIC